MTNPRESKIRHLKLLSDEIHLLRRNLEQITQVAAIRSANIEVLQRLVSASNLIQIANEIVDLQTEKLEEENE